MRYAVCIGWLIVLGLAGAVAAAEPSTKEEQTKVGENQGLTLEDIGRGLKSAAKNIEQEIPKIGSAIGNTVKKVTEKEPSKEKESNRSTEEQSTKSRK